jgi:protein-tyrosine phosphatase
VTKERRVQKKTKEGKSERKLKYMKVLFLCTDNFTRSVIAEFCMRDYIRKNSLDSIKVASAGIRGNSDISQYSKIHFEIMEEMNIDFSNFMRTQFKEEFFQEYDEIIGMSQLHKEHIKNEYNREIRIFNEILKGDNTSVNIGAPDSIDFNAQMRSLVEYFNRAVPVVIDKLRNEDK